MDQQPELFDTAPFGGPSRSRAGKVRPPRERRRYSLFLALLPDLPAKEQVLRLTMAMRRRGDVTGSFRPSSKWHISLPAAGFPDGTSEETLQEAGLILCRAAGTVARDIDPFEVMLNRLCSFGEPLVLKGDAGSNLPLVYLFQALAAECGKYGLRIRSRDYTPHMSLLYGEHAINHESVQPVTWMAREMVLILSDRGAKEYEFQARWPFGG